MKPGDKVKIIDDSEIEDYLKSQGFVNGAVFTIRSISEKDFHGDGGGIRLEGITMYSDLTGFEKAFRRTRFELVRGQICERCKQTPKEWLDSCQKCELIICEECQAPYDQFTQIDFTCCKDCAGE